MPHGKKNKDPPTKDPTTEEDSKDWTIYPEKAPWIVTTPQSRVRSIDQSTSSGLTLPVPPPPDLPQPPNKAAKVETSALTEEEAKILASLKELDSSGMELSKECVERMHNLEAKAKEQENQRSLSHAHLNKLNRLKDKVATAGKKLQHLDKEWIGFMKRMTDKISYHAQMYEMSRGELMESYNQKLEELRSYKAEVDQASKNLLDGEDTLPVPLEEQEISQPYLALTQMIQEQQNKAIMISDDDMEETADTVETDEQQEGKAGSQPKHKPVAFRNTAGSPSKVAVSHLKPRRDPKDKEKESRDTKESWVLNKTPSDVTRQTQPSSRRQKIQKTAHTWIARERKWPFLRQFRFFSSVRAIRTILLTRPCFVTMSNPDWEAVGI